MIWTERKIKCPLLGFCEWANFALQNAMKNIQTNEIKISYLWWESLKMAFNWNHLLKVINIYDFELVNGNDLHAPN